MMQGKYCLDVYLCRQLIQISLEKDTFRRPYCSPGRQSTLHCLESDNVRNLLLYLNPDKKEERYAMRTAIGVTWDILPG